MKLIYDIWLFILPIDYDLVLICDIDIVDC